MIAPHLVECLGWTLLHSLWQLTLLAALCGGVLALLRDRSPQARYVAAGVGLLAMLAAPLATLAWLNSQTPPRHAARAGDLSLTVLDAPSSLDGSSSSPFADIGSDAPEPNHSRISEPAFYPAFSVPGVAASDDFDRVVGSDEFWMLSLRTTIESLLPALVAIWLAGVCLGSCRSLGGWWLVERLRRRGVLPVGPPLSARLSELSGRLGLHRAVALLETSRISVPGVVGWLRPAILLPLGLASRIPPDQLEAILLHELAHIRRRDYLANGLQIVAETLLFHHPAVWWISRRIRLERECCADALAASACGNRIVYARALAALEEQRSGSPGWVVAASGSDLRQRIERLLGVRSRPAGYPGHWLIGLLASLLLVAAATWDPVRANDESPTLVDGPQTTQVSTNDEAPVPAAADLQNEPEPQETPLDNLWYAFQELLEYALAPPLPVMHEYVFQVQTADGRPIAGATATVTSLGIPGGASMGIPPEFAPPTVQSDAEGLVRVDLSAFYESPLVPALGGHLRRGVESLHLQVDHPDHPPLSTILWVADAPLPGARKIVLAPASTVEIRARSEGESALVQGLYPLLRGAGERWSETDGVLTIRRLDLTSTNAARWMRVVHVPPQGPAWFGDLIDLKQRVGDPVVIETTLKPGVRVAGRISDEVPRPIQNGRVVAAVYSGPDSHETVFWGTVAEIAPDGTFVLESLPAGDDAQLVAFCDGWVSQSPTLAELDAYVAAHEFPLDPRYRRADAQQFGMLHPQLHRLSAPVTEAVIPMERTASCRVTVVDQEGAPVANAQVAINPAPMQSFFRSNGSFPLGTGWDMPAAVRTRIATGAMPPAGVFTSRPSFEVTTDDDGVATISHLAGGISSFVDGWWFPLSVLHPDYHWANGYTTARGPAVTLKSGKSGELLVRLRRR